VLPSPDALAPLDDPVRASLRGAHAHLARSHGSAAAYDGEVATFCAVPPAPGPEDWADLAALLGPDGFADLFSAEVTPPADWAPVFTMPGLQLTLSAPGPAPSVDAEVVELGAADVPEMLALAEETRPGPFWRRTHELGGYLGVRTGGRLVAMTGERLRPPGWTEISAVCVAPEARGRGLAALLVLEAVRRIEARGEGAFLHVVAENVAALGLYRRLGFEVRREVVFHGYRTPGFGGAC
jgi:ribosomal protein S18 acetylase RimI-like enzyme